MLTKYTRLSFLSISWMRTELIAHSVIARYRRKSDYSFGRVRIEGDVMKFMILVKASLHSIVHSKFSFSLKAEKKKKDLSPIQERKREREGRRLVSCCTSFTLVGLLISMITWHLLRFTSIPLLFNIYPMNFPSCTPKENLVGFRRMSYFLTDYWISSMSSA